MEPDLGEQLDDASVPRGAAGETVDRQAFADDRADAHARVQRRVGILKDDLHEAPRAAHFGGGERSEIDAVEAHVARRRLDQSQDRTPERGLAATGFADHAEGLGATHVEIDAANRAHELLLRK